VFVICFIFVFTKYYRYAVGQQQAELAAARKEEKK